MLRKRSFTIAKHRTSVALEPEFWAALERIASARGLSLARLVAEIDAGKRGLLASALRVHALLTAAAAAPAQKNGPRGAKPVRPKSGESV
jgi:predicted DNA-binding ribbon-helix-helix protein